MNPNIWGPKAWYFLHTITFSYPDNPTPQDKQDAENFFRVLGTQLPCESCKNNYKKHLKKHPLTNQELSSRDSLSRWLVDIHNEVNIMTNKNVFPYDKVVTKYTNSKDLNRDICIVFLVILVIILIIILYKKN